APAVFFRHPPTLSVPCIPGRVLRLGQSPPPLASLRLPDASSSLQCALHSRRICVPQVGESTTPERFHLLDVPLSVGGTHSCLVCVPTRRPADPPPDRPGPLATARWPPQSL